MKQPQIPQHPIKQRNLFGQLLQSLPFPFQDTASFLGMLITITACYSVQPHKSRLHKLCQHGDVLQGTIDVVNEPLCESSETAQHLSFKHHVEPSGI